MKKILFFPLLNSMPSGHHQVADTICEILAVQPHQFICKKVDLLSEWNSLIEAAAVKTYLSWIRHAPNSYAWVYHNLAYQSKRPDSHKYYEMLFINKTEKIIAEEKPDMIICTHGFPSLFINKLKETGKLQVPCINIYTDFFINDVWGKSEIDYHFVSNKFNKEQLIEKYNLPEENILITGIPVSHVFQSKTKSETQESVNILIAGGSVGLGGISSITQNFKHNNKCRLHILCGINQALYDKTRALNNSSIQAYSYISSKNEMDRLYNLADAILTKPGGVTVSEALKKEVPIFVQSALPGQEEINLNILLEQGLVFKIPEGENPVAYICRTLENPARMEKYKLAVEAYKKQMVLKDSKEIQHFISKSLIGS